MSNKLFILLLLPLAVLVASQETSQAPSTYLSAYLTVYILPPASSTIYVSCWSNSSSSRFEPRNFSYPGEFAWSVTSDYSNTYSAYWCRARLGSNVLTQFPIFGAGVERNSSEWLINSCGRRRISLNGNFSDDNRSNWVIT